ncbi:MAG: hypothetical protein MJ211_14645 [Bacteroidales bacterium]|nr:hypothetical protein [Bacteroidales bacterium]
MIHPFLNNLFCKTCIIALILFSVSYATAQDLPDSAQRYTKIISDGSVSDSVLNIINNFTNPIRAYSQDLIVEKLEPSIQTLRILGIEKELNEKEKNPKLDSLEKKGYMTKTLSNGNNKNLSNSTETDLEVSGPIGGGFTLYAKVQESEMPVDDDGTTRQISELSSAVVQLKNKNTTFSAGDIFISQSGTDFSNFQKKIKGIEISSYQKTNKNLFDSIFTTIDLSMLKGKYKRQQIVGLDNSQGPYYLTANNSNQSVIVLTGTETVYVDGQKLIRGEDNDYIIDYNSGSITFMPHIQISSQSLITVDFEYNESTYNSRFVNILAGTKVNNTTITFGYLSESDNINSADLNDKDLEILSNSDPKSDFVYNSTEIAEEYSTNKILYYKVDTIVDFVNYSIFKYSQIENDKQLYSVSFNYCGTNKGNYIISSTNSANGTVYKWVSPIDGIPSGDYEPIKTIITPKSKSYFQLFTKTQPDTNTIFKTETVLSKNITNRLVSKSNYNNSYAGSYTYFHKFINNDTLKYSSITANFKFSSKGFVAPINNKSVDFERQWNINNYLPGNQEQFFNLDFEKYSKDGLSAKYSAKLANVDNIFKGVGNMLMINYYHNNIKINVGGNVFNSKIDSCLNTRISTKANFEYKIGTYINGFSFNNKISQTENYVDTTDLNFNDIKYYTGFENDSNKIILTLNRRNTFTDFDFFANQIGYTNSLSTEFQLKKDNFRISSIEILKQNQTPIFSSDTLNTLNTTSITGKTEISTFFFNKQLAINVNYQSESGTEEQAGYIFLKTSAGNGYFVWNDYNNNGIQELNEFERAFYQSDADYVKYYIHTNKYINTISGRYGLNIVWNGNINKYNSWINKYLLGRITQIVQVFNTTKSATNNKLSFFASSDSIINKSLQQKYSTRLLTINNLWLLYNNSQSNNNNLTFYGNESNIQNNNSYGFETLIINKLKLEYLYSKGKNKYNSEFFPDKNYRIQLYQNSGELNFDLSHIINMSIIYNNIHKNNTTDFSKLKTNSLTAKLNFGSPTSGNATLSISGVNNKYSGISNNAVSYQMLEGLSDGNNLVINASSTINLSKYFQLTLTFEMRGSENQKTIYTGNMAIKLIMN